MNSLIPNTCLSARFLIVLGALMAQVGCGGGAGLDDSSSSSSSGTSASSSQCNGNYQDVYSLPQRKSNNKGNAQCVTMIDAMESYRQAAIQNCAAGDIASANTNYSYYKKYYPLLGSVCK